MENTFKDQHWQVVDDYDKYEPYSTENPQIYIWDGDEQASGPICDMGEMGDMNYAEVLERAILIASAPDLLRENTHLKEVNSELVEALKYTKEWINCWTEHLPTNKDAMVIIEQVLLKATGK